jgi:geranylgeranyl diphosphate synthase, type II
MKTTPLTPPVAAHVSIDEARLLVNDYLSAYFVEKISNAALLHPSYARLWEYTYALFSAGGKRFRPYMTLLSYQAAGGDRPLSDIIPAASAQEILHLALLVHDDIIDRDTVRYGVANIAGQYRQSYAGTLNQEDIEHYANAAAILAGDLLLSGAYELTGRLNLPANDVVEATKTLSEAIFAVAGGELLDTESAFSGNPANAESIAAHKTASYSFIGPLVMGAKLADAPEQYIEHLTAFGSNLGIAFQLQDDVLSVFGDSSITGKTTIGDIREGKRTYLTEQFYRLASNEQKERFKRLYGKVTISEADAEVVRTLLQDSGARQATHERISTFSIRAAEALSELQLRPPYHEAFEKLIVLSTRRVT